MPSISLRSLDVILSIALGLAIMQPRRLAWAHPAPSASASPSAPAPVTTTSPEQATATARARFSEAIPLMKQGRWQAAYPLLLEAWKNRQHWQIALNLGRTEFELGKFKEAVESFAFVELTLDASPEAQKEASEFKEQAKAKLCVLHIDASPPGARVFIDDVIVDKSPVAAPISVNPGPHDVEVRFGGRRDKKHIDAKSGETTDVLLALRILDADPQATGAATVAPSPVPDVTASSLKSAKPWIAIGGAILSASGVGIGFGAAAASISKSRELDEKGHIPANQQLENDRAMLANVAVWSFVGAGLFVGATVAAVILLPSPAPKKVSLELRPAGTGLSLTGRW